MDIAALSVVMANSSVKGQAGMLVAKQQMEAMKNQGTELVDMIEKSVTPNKGQSIDIKL